MENRKLQSRNTFAMIFVLLLAMTLMVPKTSAQPKIDILRYKVITDPDAQVEAMQNCSLDVLTGLTRTGDIEKLRTEGFTVVSTRGFHIFFIGFNVRPQIPFYPLADASFRHALAHSVDKNRIVDEVGGYTKKPVNSMVPPSLGGWHNPNVDPHPYNLGDPFDITSLTADAVSGQTIVDVADASIFEVGDNVWIADETSEDNWEINVVADFDVVRNRLIMENALANTYLVAANGVVAIHDHSTCSILREARYKFVDVGSNGPPVGEDDYWQMPNGEPLPDIHIFTRTYEEDPQAVEAMNLWIEFLANIGLAATDYNNFTGLTHRMSYPPWADVWIRNDYWPLAWLLHMVYIQQRFDAFAIGFHLDRFPDYLYDWFHSSQDFLGGSNCFGVSDPVLDDLLETIKFSLNPEEILQAAWEAQERLTEVLPTIPLYSKLYFDAFKPGLLGIVKSPGYGADNMWTHLNIHWELGPPTQTVVWCLKDEPDIFNPLSGNAYAWEFMERVFDPLMAVNPYNHRDTPWIATDWMVVQTPIGMDVTYVLRNDVFRQDGLQYTAWDAEFSLEFIRDNQIPRYKSAWQNITDVEVINDFTFTVHANATSQFLIYDWAVLATLLPPEVWTDWNGLPLEVILARDLSMEQGWNGVTPTNLTGTGPFTFQFYNWTAMYGDLWQNPDYFLTTQEIHDLKVEMFWECGDVNRDGYIDIWDITRICLSYGCFWYDPCYDPDADLNQDGIIDIMDLSTCGFHLGEQREYPVPTEDP